MRGTGDKGKLRDLGLNSWKNVGPFSGEDVEDREEWGNTVRGERLSRAENLEFHLGMVELRSFVLEIFPEPCRRRL